MSKSSWGNVGAWAEEAEQAEAEEREAAAKASAAAPSSGFPSLKESVTTAKQKKKTKMTLQEFTMQHSAHSGSGTGQRLTMEEMLCLPTGPKQRSGDELRSGRLGGGFSNYGSRVGSSTYNNNNNTGFPREVDGRRSYGYEEDERRGVPSLSTASDFNQPSRADEVDNWASMKKPTVMQNVNPLGGGVGAGAGPGIASRADEVDNWASLKKPTEQNRPSNFGSVASSTEPDRWVRNALSFGSVSTVPETDNWRRSQQNIPLDPSNDTEVVKKVNKPNPFGSARPREEVLTDSGLDWKKLDLKIDEQNPRSVDGGSRPTSSHSSRIEGSVPSSEAIVKQKHKVNPFGDAKPREVLLAEKGLDWRKVDLELENRRVERTETEKEKKLKEEIETLRKELLGRSDEEKVRIHDQILQKERDLEEMIRRTLDRPSSGSNRGGFSERAPEGPKVGNAADRPRSRPGSYGGRQSGFPERPHSRSGSHDYNNERPRSRGASNSWTRPSDDTRSSQGGVNRRYADVDRSGPRW